MWVLIFDFPLICPFETTALISFSAKKTSEYPLCAKLSPPVIKPKGEGQKERKKKLRGSSVGRLLWMLPSGQRVDFLLLQVRPQRWVSPPSPGQPDRHKSLGRGLVPPCSKRCICSLVDFCWSFLPPPSVHLKTFLWKRIPL